MIFYHEMEKEMIEFKGILSAEEAMVAVERNGYALQYVLNKSLFISIAEKFGISIALPSYPTIHKTSPNSKAHQK